MCDMRYAICDIYDAAKETIYTETTSFHITAIGGTLHFAAVTAVFGSVIRKLRHKGSLHTVLCWEGNLLICPCGRLASTSMYV
jgi:hypothetical protein